MLSAPNQLINTTYEYAPFVLRGIRVYPDKPFKFDFLIDEGQTKLTKQQVKEEAKRHINYFLASLTIPEEDLWANLSPYEENRIIPNELSLTDMGKDMLSQDYILKQLLSSLTYPESPQGKLFWDKVYKKVQEKLGTTNIPIDTFNKIWIVPEKAVVYEEGNLAFVGEARLKVLLEEDYLALRNEGRGARGEGRGDEWDIIPGYERHNPPHNRTRNKPRKTLHSTKTNIPLPNPGSLV